MRRCFPFWCFGWLTAEQSTRILPLLLVMRQLITHWEVVTKILEMFIIPLKVFTVVLKIIQNTRRRSEIQVFFVFATTSPTLVLATINILEMMGTLSECVHHRRINPYPVLTRTNFYVEGWPRHLLFKNLCILDTSSLISWILHKIMRFLYWITWAEKRQEEVFLKISYTQAIELGEVSSWFT